MPELTFEVEGAEAVPYAASPLLALKLRVTNVEAKELIQTIVLRCQVQIETTRRRYDAAEQERLRDLFGEPHRWGRTLRSMLWTNTSVAVPPFKGSTLVDLQLPCTFDFNVAATKYFAGLEGGEIPLNLLFSGTVFYQEENRGLQVAQIPWEKEARFSLPVNVWREMIAAYYPNTAWLCLRRDVFDRLYRYKVRRGIPTWEQALETIVPEIEEPAPRAKVERPNAEESVH